MLKVVLGVGAGAAVIAVGTMRFRSVRSCQRVLVASKAELKLRAVHKALDAEVEGRSALSMVADQPVGLEQTLQGARNRMNNMLGSKELSKEAFSLAVAIENGCDSHCVLQLLFV